MTRITASRPYRRNYYTEPDELGFGLAYHRDINGNIIYDDEGKPIIEHTRRRNGELIKDNKVPSTGLTKVLVDGVWKVMTAKEYEDYKNNLGTYYAPRQSSVSGASIFDITNPNSPLYKPEETEPGGGGGESDAEDNTLLYVGIGIVAFILFYFILK